MLNVFKNTKMWGLGTRVGTQKAMKSNNQETDQEFFITQINNL
jgi:hypothetical protein